MKYFFDDLDALSRYTTNLDSMSLLCDDCQCFGQFVSHGFFYRHLSSQQITVAGKRVMCSSRGHRSGCGRTIRLYLAAQVPRLHYCAATLSIFICLVVAGRPIATAYQQATSQPDTRHAYRWLHQLHRQLPRFRHTLIAHHYPISYENKGSAPHARACLYTSLRDLFNVLVAPACATYQTLTQRPFL